MGPEFRHGNTYSAHPVGCAAALANIAILEQEEVLRHVQELSPMLQHRLRALRNHLGRPILDADSVGLLGHVELAPLGVMSATAATNAVITRMRHHGVTARGAGPVVTVSPPLIISEDDLAQVLTVAR
jgi:adenosylmethionine-8-amino-7-oxononanoate aminotransferase